jgi:hypothetical protein
VFVEKIRVNTRSQSDNLFWDAIAWLKENVGPLKHHTDYYICTDGTPYEIVCKQLLKVYWEITPTEYIDDITQYVGEGWTIYRTSETDFCRADGQYKSYALYVVMPDELMLIQCKLATLTEKSGVL